nr:nitrate- and nitrite sensing domain-containing protein [Micromonospora sp. DSM 115978]
AQAAVESAERRLSRIAGVRTAAASAVNPDAVRVTYSTVIDGLVEMIDLIPQGQDDVELRRTVTATHSLTRANELLAQQQTLVYGLLLLETDDTSDAREFVFLDTSRDEALENFRRDASRDQLTMYEETVTGLDVELTDEYGETVLNRQPGAPIEVETE